MKRELFAIAMILLVFVTCSKYKSQPDDTSQNGDIRGRLFLYDTITGSYTDILPVKSQAVTISYDTAANTNNFLYSTQSDTAGYFVFNNLLNDHKYRLHYQQTINGIIYTADTLVLEGNESISLISGVSTTLNNGIAYIFTDAQGGRVPGINVCAFTSPVLGAADTCAGSSFQLPPSDASGRTYKFDVRPGIYYNFISANYPNFVVRKHDQDTVTASGFKIKYVQVP